ncbi:uncharacterized protein LOC122709172 [Cervus elaphus]|uniref:uncharacterized protein LOC122709172 n=1 Tax=Cervus elaphus TaxID=9860 RepID=UPI001CC2F152|nr:uncharacterized protein LOC122709172 [Cervus elaphus]
MVAECQPFSDDALKDLIHTKRNIRWRVAARSGSISSECAGVSGGRCEGGGVGTPELPGPSLREGKVETGSVPSARRPGPGSSADTKVHVSIIPGVQVGTPTGFERQGLIQDGEQVGNGRAPHGTADRSRSSEPPAPSPRTRGRSLTPATEPREGTGGKVCPRGTGMRPAGCGASRDADWRCWWATWCLPSWAVTPPTSPHSWAPTGLLGPPSRCWTFSSRGTDASSLTAMRMVDPCTS